MFFVMLSFAEMASIAPTAGGQYHWVSEFSSRKHQRLLSYVTGWFALLGWRTSLVGTAYAAGQQFEAMIALSDSSYSIKGWQGCLFTIGLTGITIFFNTILFRKLPSVIVVVVIFHFVGYVSEGHKPSPCINQTCCRRQAQSVSDTFRYVCDILLDLQQMLTLRSF